MSFNSFFASLSTLELVFMLLGIAAPILCLVWFFLLLGVTQPDLLRKGLPIVVKKRDKIAFRRYKLVLKRKIQWFEGKRLLCNYSDLRRMKHPADPAT